MKKFEEYLEMAVKIRDNVLSEISEEDFLAAIREVGIKSSYVAAYDNQEIGWKKVAAKFGVTIEKLAEAYRYLNIDPSFPGIEGLAILSGKRELYNESDYGVTEFNSQSGDQFITSMFYGGRRAQNWIKNLRNIYLVRFTEEMENYDRCGSHNFISSDSTKSVKMTSTFENKDDVEKAKKAFELMDKWFDFDLELNKGENGTFVLSGLVIEK